MSNMPIRPAYSMWPQYNRRLRDVVAAMTDEQLAISACARALAALAAPDDPTAGANEARWQQSHATPAVRDVLRRLPPPPRSAGMLGALISDRQARVGGAGSSASA